MYKIGDVVKINQSFLGQLAGVRAIVYEVYTDFDDASKQGCCVITETGCDIGGFSYDEQKAFLSHEYSTPLRYEFKNVMQLSRDWDAGVFKKYFN